MKVLFPTLLVVAVAATALGFNTLDCMINKFAWLPPLDYRNPVWHMNTWFVMDFWNCYVLFGVLPFALGCGLAGYLIGWVVHGEM